jgi:hypothetical protein
MNQSDSKGERSIALFLLGILLFNPPLLSIFSADIAFAGIPLLYIYLFLAWLVFILLIGLISEIGMERRRNQRVPHLPGDSRSADQAAVPQHSLPNSVGPRGPRPAKAPRPPSDQPDDGTNEPPNRGFW